ncbi:MAG: DUF2927 domain-containing protein [Calditrichota bacterium]
MKKNSASPEPEPVIYKVASYTKEKRLEDHAQYFLDIALGAEYGVGDFRIKKWVDDIRIEVMGEPTYEDLQELKRVVTELNELLGGNLTLSMVKSKGNVDFHFLPHNRFYEYEPSGLVFTNGFFWNWWNYAGEIYRGRVVIGSDRISQALRNHLIREELTQLLGLMNDSMKYPESIFYQGHSEVKSYTDFDKAVIRMLYDSSLKPGTLDFEVMDWVKKQ